jgi:hypothetical protein
VSSSPANHAGEEVDVAEQWAGDPLAQFLAAAWRNTVSAFSAERQRYRSLAEVDAVYRRLIENLDESSERISITFLVRSHGSFLAAASLALSGQVAEAYALMRTAMKAALQGLYINGSPERQQLWVSRNDDDVARQRMQAEFNSDAPLRHLQEIDPSTAGIYEKLRDRTIDRGAHPNTYANLARSAERGAAGVDFTREYFVCEDDVQRSCLRSAVQVGICCLSIFFYVFPDRYRALELDTSINKLRQGH